MAVISLKLRDDLKLGISQLVEGTDRTADSFMVEAIEQAAKREELRRRFGAEAELAEQEPSKTGKAYDAAEAFRYLESRAQGKRAKRLRMKS